MDNRKWQNLLILILLLTVGYLYYRNWKPKGIAMGSGELSARRIGSQTLRLESPVKQSSRILALTLTVTAQPQQLPAGKPVFGILRVTTPDTNSGDVYLADTVGAITTGPRFSIAKGTTEEIRVSEISKLYFGGTTNDILSVYSEVESVA